MRKLLLTLILLILLIGSTPLGAMAAAAAETGAQAQYLRGSDLMQKGEYEAAAVWLGRAADQGYAPAQRDLALLYKAGTGVTESNAKAGELLRRAADQNDTEAMYHLGLLSLEAPEPDYNAVAGLWREAAERGFEPAALNLGRFYFHGYGGAPDYALAVNWLEKAHDLGSTIAAYDLGLLYLHDLDGVKNPALALKWLESAAALANDDAKYLLGRLYYNGENWPRDFVKARTYLEAVAAYEDPEGMYCLGMLYGRGLGGAADSPRALECYESAAAQGYALAQFELGNMYYAGSGGQQKDLARAYLWLSLAADGGLPEAWEQVAMLTRGLEFQQMGQGQIALARAYFLGLGGRQDAVKAYSHLLIAREYGQNVDEMLGTLRGLTDAERAQGGQMARDWLRSTSELRP